MFITKEGQSVIKVLIMGEEQSGKSFFIDTIEGIPFDPNKLYQPTFGCRVAIIDLLLTTIKQDEVNIIKYVHQQFDKKDTAFLKLQIWEHPGNPENRPKDLPRMFKEADICIYCLDLSKPLNHAQIQADLNQYIKQAPENARIILLGTKKDLKRQLQLEQLIDLQNKFGIAKVMESSVLDTQSRKNVVRAIKEIAMNPAEFQKPQCSYSLNSFFYLKCFACLSLGVIGAALLIVAILTFPPLGILAIGPGGLGYLASGAATLGGITSLYGANKIRHNFFSDKPTSVLNENIPECSNLSATVS